jgi:eukaryotic-like serine/threonine-protein kinase
MSPDLWDKLDEIFSAAIELPVPERSAFLDKHCGGDMELRREADRLLLSAESAGAFIESPVWTDSRFIDTSAKNALSNSLGEGTNGNDPDPLVGQRIGAYRLAREIGRGGMGAVYLGERDDGEFRQRVAIKLIKRGMDSDFIVRRFRHERQILASLEHPFIARLVDGGTTSDGTPYFVMEFVEGETLYRYCDGKRLSIRDRLKLFQKVCSAIQYAHDKQIIHRDIKPGNILINASGSPKLLDFGIAKILDPELIHESVNPTASMLRMMTPDYASPEQIQGGSVTPSSDIYSLGVLLYELVTGRRPYDTKGSTLQEVSQAVCDIMPPRPSEAVDDRTRLLSLYEGLPSRAAQARSVTELKTEVSGELDDIIMRALAKEPGSRYASATELTKDISRLLAGEPVRAPRYVAGPSKRPAQLLRAPDQSRSIAVLPFKFINLGGAGDTDESFLGFGLADALITRLSKIRRFIVRPTGSIMAFGEGGEDPIAAGRQLNVDLIIDGTIKKANDRLRVSVQVLNVADNAAVWATSFDETLADVLSLEDTVSARVVEALLPQLTGSEMEGFAKRGTENPEAFEHYLRGRYHFNTFTEEGLARSFVSFHSAIAADPEYALAYAGIADYYNWLGIIGVLPPQECFQPAREAASRALELDDQLSDAHASLGFSAHAGNWDWALAEKHLQRAIELNPGNANAYVWYSIVLTTEGRIDEGLQLARRAVELDPLTPFNHHNVGWTLYYGRRCEEALEQYERVVTEFPTYGFGYYGLSKIHRHTNNTKAAIEECERAGEYLGGSIFARLAKAECLAADRQIADALDELAELEKLSAQRFVSPYQMALAFSYLTKNAVTDGDEEAAARFRDSAFDLLGRAVDFKESWLNWLGMEPALDILRDDERFDELLEATGYRMLFKNFASSGVGLLGDRQPSHRALDRTTLVIEESHDTDSGLAAARDRSALRWALPVAGVSLLLLVLIGAYHLATDPSRAVDQPAQTVRFQSQRLVVMPFEANDEAGRSLGIGFADAIATKLGNLKQLEVLSASTGRAIAGTPLPSIASELNIGVVLRGRFEETDGGTIVTTELLDAATERILFREQFSADNGDLFALQTRVVENVWTALGIEPLPLERQLVERRYTSNADAYEQYLIGRYLLSRRNARDLRQAIATFGKALEYDTAFAPAYVGIADAYSLLSLYDVQPPENAYEKAREYALKAIELDDDLAEAHASIAYIRFYKDRDRQGAELDFRRALQLNPSNAQGHHWFALFLAAIEKKMDAAQEIEHAKRLDPRSLSVFAAAGLVHFYGGDHARAIEECDKALALDPSFIPAIKVKRWALSAAGDRLGAAAVFRNEIAFSGADQNDPSWRIIASQVEQPSPEAIRDLDTAANAPAIRNNPFAFAYEVALGYLALGQTGKALSYLEQAEAANSHGFNFLEADPRLESIRREPRFRVLLRKLKEPDQRSISSAAYR